MIDPASSARSLAARATNADFRTFPASRMENHSYLNRTAMERRRLSAASRSTSGRGCIRDRFVNPYSFAPRLPV